MSKWSFAVILWLGIVILTVMVWWIYYSVGTPTTAMLKPANAAIVSTGHVIYDRQCASCHGKNLEGAEDWKTRDSEGYLPAPPHDENGHTWHHTDDILFGLTKFGLVKFSGLQDYKTRMPAYEGILTDDEIVAVLSYIKSRWPEETQFRHDQLNARNLESEK